MDDAEERTMTDDELVDAQQHAAADDIDEAGETVTEISYDEQRYPARPRRLRPRDQFRGGTLRRFLTDPRTQVGREATGDIVALALELGEAGAGGRS